MAYLSPSHELSKALEQQPQQLVTVLPLETPIISRASRFTISMSLSTRQQDHEYTYPRSSLFPCAFSLRFPPAGRNCIPSEEQPHFNNFMAEVEQGYGSGKGPGETNIYHNRRHAADVTQAVHYFLRVSST